VSLDTELLAALRTVEAKSYPFPASPKPTGLYATYQRVTGRRHGTLNSGLGAPRASFQIDCWSTVKGQAVELAEAFKAALPDLLKVGDITDNPDDFETDTGLHRASFDVVLWT